MAAQPRSAHRGQRTTNVKGARALRKQLNIRVESGLYHALDIVARQERRTVPQTARQLMEDGLRLRVQPGARPDDTSGRDIAPLALAGGAFDWLTDEPDAYDDTAGEPI